jgi:putative ABC transport system permease protein
VHGIDVARYAAGALVAHPLRSSLTALGVALGIAAVILLTAIGEGVNRYVMAEFTQFGTNLIGINPGKVETFGVSGALISNVRPLSLDDAEALSRVDGVVAVEPLVQGNARVEVGNRDRRTTVFGVGPRVPEVWSLPVAMGRFLPEEGYHHPRAYAVLGSKLKAELFGDANPLGARIRIGGERYRVIGVMTSKGQMLGFDLDDAVYIPVAKALAMFDRESLMEIDVLYRPGRSSEEIAAGLRQVLIRRHGHEDFTITTQDQMLATLDSILGVLTFAVGALGGISLLVGGVGILTIMTIAVQERTGEIGLLRALGAGEGQIRALFLAEAGAISAVGGLAGLTVGIGVAQLLRVSVAALPVQTSWAYVGLAEAIALGVGLAAGVGPAVRAARLTPLEALRAE